MASMPTTQFDQFFPNWNWRIQEILRGNCSDELAVYKTGQRSYDEPLSAVAHLLWGTLSLFSLLFFSVADAATILARYIGSVVVCRVLLMYELAEMRAACRRHRPTVSEEEMRRGKGPEKLRQSHGRSDTEYTKVNSPGPSMMSPPAELVEMRFKHDDKHVHTF